MCVTLWISCKMLSQIRKSIFSKKSILYAKCITILENLGKKELLINLDRGENYNKVVKMRSKVDILERTPSVYLQLTRFTAIRGQ